MRLKLLLALSTLFLPMALLATSAPAGATGSCASGYYPQATYSSGGSAAAVLCLSSEGNGPYWRLDALGRYRGVSKYMSLKVCELAASGAPSNRCRSDAGNFSIYAGPVSDAGYACLWVHSVMRDTAGRTVVDKVKTVCN